MAVDTGMKRIQLLARYPDRLLHPLHRRIVEGTSITRAELLMWTPTDDATTLLWCDGSREETAAAIDAIESLLVSNLVEDIGGTYAFLQQDSFEFPTAILDVIADANVIFLPPVVFKSTGEVSFEAVGEASGLSTLHEALSNLGELTIEQVREFEREHSPSNLTDRQRAALEAAASVGYYDVPRSGTTSDIATRLDCAPSTAGELVRKAEAAVIRSFLDGR